MFLLPFLSYFRPYVWRIAISLICVVLVGALAITPLLMGQAALEVLPELIPRAERAAQQREAEASGVGLIGSFKGLGHKSSATHPQAAATTGTQGALPTTATLATADPKELLSSELEHLGGTPLAKAKAWFDQRRDGFKSWYEHRRSTNPIALLLMLAGAWVLLTMIKGLAEYIYRYHLSHTFILTNLCMREDIYRNVLRQDYLYFSRNGVGLLHSRINSDAKAIGDILESMLSDAIQQPVTMVALFGYLLYLEASLTLIVIVILPLMAGILYYFARVLRKNTRRQKKEADQLSAILTESLNNIRLIKAFGSENFEAAKYHERTLKLFHSLMARRMAKFGASPIMESLGTLVGALVMLAGGWLLASGRMTLVELIMYLATLTRFYRPIRMMAAVNTKWQLARVSADRMREMLGLAPAVFDQPDARPFDTLASGIELRGINFSYGGEQVLRGIDLSVAAGHSIAFAGPSGSGKTTLLNILARLIDPDSGQVLVDGHDLRTLRVADWRRRLAIVTQDTYLFDDTIQNNIAYDAGTPDAERVEWAARAANAHEFILAMEGGAGYQTRIGPSGTRLSGGQRQRIAIARALYRDPQILILDEATSALDAQSQAAVQEALTRLMVGRTTFIVAHRISTIRNVDRIYVLENGAIAECGTHEELLAAGGLYHRLALQLPAPAPTGEAPNAPVMADGPAPLA